MIFHDPFKKCPVLETEHFFLRLVQLEDAENLLKCYDELRMTELFAADKYIRDFRYQTLEDMHECIRFWLDEYHNRMYIRFSVIDKHTGCAIGTVEMFDATEHLSACDTMGILRLDLCVQYEKQLYLQELLKLCTNSFYQFFNVKPIVTLAIPSAKERIYALHALNFEPYDWPNSTRQHYWADQKE